MLLLFGRRFRQRVKSAMAMRAKMAPPIAHPIPTPAAAPFESPLCVVCDRVPLVVPLPVVTAVGVGLGLKEEVAELEKVELSPMLIDVLIQSLRRCDDTATNYGENEFV